MMRHINLHVGWDDDWVRVRNGIIKGGVLYNINTKFPDGFLMDRVGVGTKFTWQRGVVGHPECLVRKDRC
jgi:hypothetical protein